MLLRWEFTEAELKDIPEGPYCYRITSIEEATGDLPPKIHTKVCPHWQYIEHMRAKCTLINRDDNDDHSSGLLWDQVKECRLKLGEDPE